MSKIGEWCFPSARIREIFLIFLTRQGACCRRLFRWSSAPICSISHIWIGRLDCRCTFKLSFSSADHQTLFLCILGSLYLWLFSYRQRSSSSITEAGGRPKKNQHTWKINIEIVNIEKNICLCKAGCLTFKIYFNLLSHITCSGLSKWYFIQPGKLDTESSDLLWITIWPALFNALYVTRETAALQYLQGREILFFSSQLKELWLTFS